MISYVCGLWYVFSVINFIQIQIAATDYVHIIVSEDLQGHYSLTAVNDGKALDDPLTGDNIIMPGGGEWSKIQPADEKTQLIANKVTLKEL